MFRSYIILKTGDYSSPDLVPGAARPLSGEPGEVGGELRAGRHLALGPEVVSCPPTLRPTALELTVKKEKLLLNIQCCSNLPIF